MFENIINFFKNLGKSDKSNKKTNASKDTAKERLHLVLMQDRANVSADFLDLMRKEIIEVIKKYVDVDESEIDVRMTSKQNDDGTNGAPALYANIPILNIRNDVLVEKKKEVEKQENSTAQEKAKSEEEFQETSKDKELTKNQEKNDEVKENDKETNDENEPIQKEVSEKVEEIVGQN